MFGIFFVFEDQVWKDGRYRKVYRSSGKEKVGLIGDVSIQQVCGDSLVNMSSRLSKPDIYWVERLGLVFWYALANKNQEKLSSSVKTQTRKAIQPRMRMYQQSEQCSTSSHNHDPSECVCGLHHIKVLSCLSYFLFLSTLKPSMSSSVVP